MAAEEKKKKKVQGKIKKNINRERKGRLKEKIASKRGKAH